MKKNQPIRVLMVLPKLEICGGVESYVMSYYRKIDRNKVSFDFVAHRADAPSYTDEIESLGGKVYIVPENYLKSPLKIMKYLNTFFAEHKCYDVVHCNMPNGSFYYLYAAKKAGIPVRIMHAHQTKYADILSHSIRNYPLIALGKKYANVRCACSKAAGDFLFKRDYHVINNALKIDRFFFNDEERTAIRLQMNLTGKTVLCNVGRFCNQKNQLFLLDIFYHVLKKNKDSVLLLIGDGENRDVIIEKIENLGLKGNVILPGVQKDISKYLMVSDVFVLPSLYEGLPIVGLEAQASGLPCVVADTVTKELDVAGNVVYCPLKNSPESWSEIIIAQSQKQRMTKNVIMKKMRDSGYDIEYEVKKLEDFYIKCAEDDGDSL